jgi:aldose 1-epimerase
MDTIRVAADGITVEISPLFGAIWRFEVAIDGRTVPLMRSPGPDAPAVATSACCFPMVPFGNRVRGNRFTFEGRDYVLEPNVDWDPHYLHGDGWISRWQVDRATESSLALSLVHGASRQSPYVYVSHQTFEIVDRALVTTLSVTNRGACALPFGIGWHPFFPSTEGTTLRASSSNYWEEGKGWLPTERRALPPDLDFNTLRHLPAHWVNNGFEGWDGQARIDWPDHGIALDIDADPLFSRYFVFVSDTKFDPSFRGDFFCFEPMSHSADGHHLPDGGNLKRLPPGETLSGTIRWKISGRESPM